MTRLYTEAERAAAAERLMRAAESVVENGCLCEGEQGCVNCGDLEALDQALCVMKRDPVVAPVAQPDLSRLAEAVREACQEAATTAETRIDAIDAIRSLDLAPIIAGTGLVKLPVIATCGECKECAPYGGYKNRRPVMFCDHARAPGRTDVAGESGHLVVDDRKPPPDWCPLRTPRKGQR